MGRGCQTQQLFTPGDSWVVDGLHIDTMLGEQEITDLAVQCCITHLGSGEKPVSICYPGPTITSSIKQVEGTRPTNIIEFGTDFFLFFIRGLVAAPEFLSRSCSEAAIKFEGLGMEVVLGTLS